MQIYVIGPIKVTLSKIRDLGETAALRSEFERNLGTCMPLATAKKLEYKILKRSLDLRQKMQAGFVYKLAINNLSDFLPLPRLQRLLSKKIIQIEKANYVWPETLQNLRTLRSASQKYLENESKRPVVVGFGPAGIFAALILAAAGMRPLVLERGKKVEQRIEDFALFQKKGILQEESNAQFGEGGAGCFSDGKLGTRIKDDLLSLVLDILVYYGADPSILWRQNPHIGTDKLRPLIKKIREAIIDLGGEIQFQTKLSDLQLLPLKNAAAGGENDSQEVYKLIGLETVSAGTKRNIACEQLILAPGHSARDIYHMLAQKKQSMSAKPFAVGFRIEQKQKAVNRVQYGKENELMLCEMLGPAEYHLACKVQVQGEERRVYTFCMCPGGEVISGTSEKESLCVNGMSYHARSGENANAAVICAVNAGDLGDDLFAGLKFQERIERAAYKLTASYAAPYCTVEDFVKSQYSGEEYERIIAAAPYAEDRNEVKADQELKSWCEEKVQVSYLPQAEKCNLGQLYPPLVSRALALGILQLNQQMACFAARKSTLIAPETRTSAPIRIERDKKTMLAEKCVGLYPCGEGAGYAGGISSAAVDGIKAAQKMLQNLLNLADDWTINYNERE